MKSRLYRNTAVLGCAALLLTLGACNRGTAPTVVFTSPANGATGVPTGSDITATFSTAMDASTLNVDTFTVSEGSTVVAGSVSYSNLTATFNPAQDLSPGTLYRVKITTDAQSEAKRHHDEVDREIGGELEGEGEQLGDGVLEAYEPYEEIRRPRILPWLLGGLFLGHLLNDGPNNALVEDFEWTFTTAAGTDPTDTTPPTVTNVAPSAGATGVPLNANVTASFSEAMNPSTINNTNFRLNLGATAVAGAITYSGTTATFNPSEALLPNSQYTARVNTGAQDLAGNALESARVWTFTTGPEPDTTAPTVTTVTPAAGATGVSRNTNVTATFSEAMNPSTINTTTFQLSLGGTAVPGAVTYSGNMATFNPTVALLPGTEYTARVTTGAQDLAGNGLASPRVWSFTTSGTEDNAAPTVSGTIPEPGSTNVPRGSSLAAIFSEVMDADTINTSTFTLSQGATPISGVVTYVGVTAVFNPSETLLSNTLYTARITTGATDIAGNALAAPFVWSFTTADTDDTTAPTVSATAPANNETGVLLGRNISATFSEAMDPLTINGATFTLRRGLNSVTGTVSYSGVTAVFNPVISLLPSTVYTATITTGAQDLAGNALANDFVWTFTTGDAPDIEAPTVLSTDPLDEAIGVPRNKQVSATFSEEMNPLTINAANFTLRQGLVVVPGIVSYSEEMATFEASTLLEANTTYTATISTNARDTAGNALEEDFVWTFSTGVTLAQNNVNLGAAGAFAILAGSTVTSTGLSIVNGDLGVSPGEAVAGFPPAVLIGEQFTGVGSAAGEAKEALSQAFNEAASRSDGAISLPGDLSGLTLFPGLYTNSTSVMLSAGSVTLDAQGDSNAVFLFQMGSTLTAGSDTQVILSGGANPNNVYWQVGTSATLGTNSVFMGNVLAGASITMATGASLDGRALTQSGAVSLDAAIITMPIE